jgi:hypothetical protein
MGDKQVVMHVGTQVGYPSCVINVLLMNVKG